MNSACVELPKFSSVFSTQGVCWDLPVFLPPALWPGNSLGAAGWGNPRTDLIRFLGPGDHCSVFFDVQCLEIHWLIFLVVSGGLVNPVR